MNKMRKPVLLFGLVLIGSVFFLFPSQDIPSSFKGDNVNPHYPRLQDSVRQLFEEAVQENIITGAGVAVVTKDTILFLGGFGYRDHATKDSLDQHSVFRLGSLSKGFGGVLAQRLVEEGLLSLEDPVHHYWPDLVLYDSSSSTDLKLEHLLTHTSGLPYHTFTNLVEAGLELEEIAEKIKAIKLVGAPGEIYSYQNATFSFSEKVMEKASGQSIQELLDHYLFQPLQMEDASATYEAISTHSNVALPHAGEGSSSTPKAIEPQFYNAVLAGGINASAADMAQWMQFLLGNAPEVLDSSGLQEVFKARIDTKVRYRYFQKWWENTSSSYGLGWRIHTYADSLSSPPAILLHHGGSVNNYRAEIALFPDEEIGICVLFNRHNPLSRTVIPKTYNKIKEPLKAIRNWYPIN